jgi:thiol-disulfide isomerase/thioredoxin
VCWWPAGARFRVCCSALFVALGLLTVAGATLAAPGDSGVDLQGKSVDPIRQAAGKPVALIFVRTDCPISNRYAPAIQKLQASYADRVNFWLVYPDKEESSASIEKHLREYGYKIPVLRDPEHGLVMRSRARMTPEAAVFDGRGELIYHGRIDDWYVTFGRSRPAPTTHEAKDAMDAALSGRKPAVASTEGVGCYISDLQ